MGIIRVELAARAALCVRVNVVHLPYWLGVKGSIWRVGAEVLVGSKGSSHVEKTRNRGWSPIPDGSRTMVHKCTC
ncbi:hypothetical protein V6N11_023692 [Hibiscus sabdariffa]|uniref:Secreted protein n=1 Tax=Hibiscus sabdariffa TaxID=183260 RepID=A0ABR2TMY5_9ROSI